MQIDSKNSLENLGDACRNCGNQLDGQFCSNCGQERFDPDISFPSWMAGVLSSALRLDTRLLRTVAHLTVDPGNTTRRYIDGQRVRYIPPVRYAFLSCAIWLFCLSLIVPADEQEFMSFFRRFGQLGTLVTLPLLASLTWLVFRQPAVRYRDHVALILYWAGHSYLVRSFLILATLVFALPDETMNAIDAVFVNVFLAWALLRFHWGISSWILLRAVAGVIAVHLCSKLLFMGAIAIFFKMSGGV